MDPMSFSELEFDTSESHYLLDLARQAIVYGLQQGRCLPLKTAGLSPRLQVPRASFVTLHRQGRLRGCCGSLLARRSLAEDVIASAYAAAFEDSRFGLVVAEEIDDLAISISVLSPLEPLPAGSEDQLLAALKPGQDGLLLEDGSHRGTFLPVMWQQLPQPADFLRQLKLKAGLPPDYWSAHIRFSRYQAVHLGD